MDTQVAVEPRAARDESPSKRRVVIVGGGYAGVTVAVNLGRQLARHPELGCEIVLVEPNPCQQALSELDLVAVGPEQPEFCELWLPAVLKNMPVRTCFNRVETIYPKRKMIRLGSGEEIEYWRAVVCTGAVPSIPPIPGLAEHGLSMWSVADAQELQRRTVARFKAAARLPDTEARREALSFTVCGGGATGVEIVGTMGQLLPRRAAEAGLEPGDLNVSLVEGRPEILYDLPATQRNQARRRLERMGVNVVTGSMVRSVENGAVILEDGRRVPSQVLVWCGGAKADPHARDWGFTIDNSGRIRVNDVLKTIYYDDVYALGDVAAFQDPSSNRTLPMLAQFAIREAQHTSVNILRELRGMQLEPYHPHMHGEFVSVGPRWGVGWMWRLSLSGWPAIIMKRMTYVMYWWQVGGAPLAWSRARELLSMQR